MKKILTSPSSMGQVGPEPFNLLRSQGYEVVNNPYRRKLTKEEVIDLAKDCVGIVAGVESLDKEVLSQLPNIRCISRVGVGMDSVDLDYCKKHGIIVRNTPDGPTQAVAELTIGLMFSLLRKIPQAHKDLSSGVWKKQTGNLLKGKKVGIIGLGRIGRKVAKMLSVFDVELIGVDPYVDPSLLEGLNVKIMSLENMLKEADIINIHSPSFDKPILGSKELSQIKSGAMLVNVSRGGTVDEDKLLELLKIGHISAAAIDVFNNEPYSGPLTQLDNVVLTPHLGSYAKEGKLQMEIDAVNNLIEALKD